MANTPIAVTGLGLVCPLGNSVPEAVARARRGERGIRSYATPWGTRVGGTVDQFTPDPQLASRHEPATLFALAAAEQALAQSGLGGCGDRNRIGCVVGAGLAGAALWQRALEDDRIPRMAAIAITGTAVTGLLAVRHQLRGPSLGIANACASGTTAIIAAADQIRLGRADAMLVGGCESSMRGRVAYGSFVDAGMHVTDDPVGACTPFAAGRRGFVLAEGAGMLMLERLDFARARGARVLATLTGSALVNDAHHAIHPEPTGKAWARAIRLALDDAHVPPASVDAVSVHATATAQGDLAEARALQQVFGTRRVAVSATKSMHGHAFGAAGAIECALAIAAMTEGLVLPTIDLADPDPDCALDHVVDRARQVEVDVLLKTGFGAGGVATALVFRRSDSPPPFERLFAF